MDVLSNTVACDVVVSDDTAIKQHTVPMCCMGTVCIVTRVSYTYAYKATALW